MPKTSTPVDERRRAPLGAALDAPWVKGLVAPVGEGIYFVWSEVSFVTHWTRLYDRGGCV